MAFGELQRFGHQQLRHSGATGTGAHKKPSKNRDALGINLYLLLEQPYGVLRPGFADEDVASYPGQVLSDPCPDKPIWCKPSFGIAHAFNGISIESVDFPERSRTLSEVAIFPYAYLHNHPFLMGFQSSTAI
jgi:hypothetical protein